MNSVLLSAVLALSSLTTDPVAPVAQPVPVLPRTWERMNVSTNVLYDAVTSLNLAVEFPTSRKVSLQLGATYNPFTFSEGEKYKHWFVQPEIRLWRNEVMDGSYYMFHAIGGEFNINRHKMPFGLWKETRDGRFEGWGIGAGIGYGYRHNFSRVFAASAEIAVGAIYTGYDKYRCGKCGERVGSGHKVYYGPTKVAISLIARLGVPKEKKPIPQPEPAPAPPPVVIIPEPEPEPIPEPAPEPAPVKKEPVIHRAAHNLRIQFDRDKTNIDPTLGRNAQEIEELRAFLEKYINDTTITIKRVDINGWASVEGALAHNIDLSRDRAAAAGVMTEEMEPSLAGKVFTQGLGEDWDSIEFPGKEGLMQINDPDQRERKLRAMEGGRLFRRLLQKELPLSRRSEVVISFTYQDEE